jgi:hypothetical protein
MVGAELVTGVGKDQQAGFEVVEPDRRVGRHFQENDGREAKSVSRASRRTAAEAVEPFAGDGVGAPRFF